jgi:hypothetical protein
MQAAARIATLPIRIAGLTCLISILRLNFDPVVSQFVLQVSRSRVAPAHVVAASLDRETGAHLFKSWPASLIAPGQAK